jgi:hypothetical protein
MAGGVRHETGGEIEHERQLGPGSKARSMRFREDTPQELERARKAVAEWREAHPEGTAAEMVAAIGGQFHPHYAVALRGILYRIDEEKGTGR